MNDFDNKQICSYKDIDKFGFTCDVCGRKVNGCHCINGMKFCAKCYQETFGKDNQQEEIKQLIQQLEQVQTRIKELEDKDWYEANIKQLEEQNDRLIQERDNLKKQLEEKDKEINSLIIDYEKRISQEQELMSNLEKQLAEKEEELLKQKEKSARTEQIYNGIIVDKDKEIEKLKQQYTILENENGKLTTELIMDKYKKAQKEVSFGKQLAIQELEKVKVNLKDRISMMKNEEHSYLQKVVAWYDICDQINNQIKQLKEGE